MTYHEIFNEVRTELMKADVSDVGGQLALQVDITGEGEGIFYIKLADGILEVEPYDYIDHDVRFICSGKDFINIVRQKLDPVFAFTIGRLKIDGSIEKALEVQKIVNSQKKKILS